MRQRSRPSTSFSRAVRRRLLARAGPEVKANYLWYFKAAVRFIRFKTTDIRRVAREVEPLLATQPITVLIRESFHLLSSPNAEEKHVAIALLGHTSSACPPHFWTAVVRNRDRFVQLGMGWVLRELFLADRKATLGFLGRHSARINGEALRYTIEKMPKTMQRRVLAEHSMARPRRSNQAGRKPNGPQ